MAFRANVQTFHFLSLDLYRKQNFEIVFCVWTLLHSPLPSPFPFLANFFPFSFARHLLGFILVGGLWEKLSGLNERKCGWVVSITWLFAFSSVSLTELCSF